VVLKSTANLIDSSLALTNGISGNSSGIQPEPPYIDWLVQTQEFLGRGEFQEFLKQS
jgi:hypothetical protein